MGTRTCRTARAHHHGAMLGCCVAKFIMDGVLESLTAFLPGGYADRPRETGMRFFAHARDRRRRDQARSRRLVYRADPRELGAGPFQQ
jgi:predicted amidohydrolase YtcJ